MKSSRFLFLDLLKISAIILMIYNHVFLEWYRFTEPNIFYHLNNLTRMSSALFLFLSGLLLMLSFKKTPNQKVWFKQKTVRAGGLIAVSLVLFFLDPNSSLKYFYSSGILQLIGVLYLLTFPLLLIRSKRNLILALVLIYIAILFSTYTLRANEWFLPFINSYSFPLLPHASYYTLGIVTALVFPPLKKLKPIFWQLLSLCFFFTLIYLEIMIQPTALALFDLVIIQFGYWQPTLTLVVLISSLILGLYLILRNLEPRLRQIPKTNWISILSKYSLEIYVYHLLLILILKATLLPTYYSASVVMITFFGILLASLGYVLLRRKLPSRSKPT